MARIVLIRSNPVSPDPPVEKMANALLGLGHTITVIGWDRDSDYKERTVSMSMSNGEVKILRFGIKASFGAGLKGNLKPLLYFQKQVMSWLCKNRKEIDVIHAFDFDTGLIASIFTNHNNVKLVYHMLDYYVDAHNLGNGVLRSCIKHLENKVIARADATIICTEKRKAQIAGSNPKRLYVIHNTPDAKSIDENIVISRSENHAKMKIVYVGILASSRMLKEITEIVSLNENYELHIGGFGEQEEYFEDASRKYSNIYFYGKLPYSSTLALEKECDVMVAIYDPSIRNNQFAAPNKFYESLMIGKPLIMARGTGFDDIIEKNKLGVLTLFSYEGVKNALDLIWNMRDSWDDIHKRAHELYLKEYSWEIMKDRINTIYGEILHK